MLATSLKLPTARQASPSPLRQRASTERSKTVARLHSRFRPQRRQGSARAFDAERNRSKCSSSSSSPRPLVARAATEKSSTATISGGPRVAVFSSKPYVKDFLAPSLDAKFPASRYFSARLDESTTALAAGSDVAVAFVNDSADAATLKVLKDHGVGLIALRCAGFDCVDVETAAELGIKVLRVPTYSPTSVAEHSVALALSLCRKIPQAFDRARFQNYELSGLVGFQMKGKTVGIWGTGAIGTAAVAIYKVNFSFDFSFFSRFRVRGRKQRRKEKKNSKFQKNKNKKKGPGLPRSRLRQNAEP